MRTIDKAWVEEQLKFLAGRIGFAASQWLPFEPTERFYKALASSEEQDLQTAAGEIAKYLGLISVPRVIYEFTLRLDPKAAGEIRYHPGGRSVIRIPVDYAGKPMAIGGIFAHEITHEFLFSRSFVCPRGEELEPLTDLAAIYLGLGKPILNGIIADAHNRAVETSVLGYLDPELKAHAYRSVGKAHGLGKEALRRGLSDAAARLLDTHG